MSAGDDEITGFVKKPTAEEFGQRDKGDPMGEDSFELRIAAGEGITHDSEVGFGGEVFFSIAFMKGDALIAQEIGHGGVDGLVGASDLKADFAEHGRDRAHARASDAEEVKVFQVGAIEHGISNRMEERMWGVERKP